MNFIKKKELSNVLSIFVESFSSIKLSIFLLSILALVSILGTLIPQNEIFENYMSLYGQIFFSFFDFLGLFDMYHSWWYQFILFSLLINVVGCTAKKLFNINTSLLFKKELEVVRFKKFSHSFDLVLSASFDKTYKVCYLYMVEKFGFCNIERISKGIVFEAHSGMWTKIGIHVIHFSIVLLVLGGIFGYIFGFNGLVNISEGDFVSWIEVSRGNNVRCMDFEIHCDLFNIMFYKNGVPMEYRSDLVLIKKKKFIKSKSIVVNNPMSFNGIEIFQSSYGKDPFSLLDKSFFFNKIKMNFVSKVTGNTYSRILRLSDLVYLPEDSGKFCLLNYFANEYFNGVDLGPSFNGVYISSDGNVFDDVHLPLNFYTFDLMRDNRISIFLTEKFVGEAKINSQKTTTYYTGLQITSDPGKYVVYCSFFIIILGFVITIFFPRIQLYAKIEKKGDKVKVVVSGYTNRNKLIIKSMFKSLKRNFFLIN